MNMKLTYILAAALFIGALSSCKKNDDLVYEVPDTKGQDIQPLPQDIWIRDSLTTPYNIAVKYKWDALELDIYKTLVPPMESKIIPSLRAIKDVWINSYVQEAGVDFFKGLSPKQLMMVGSADYQTDGTTILGTAEAGRKIVLFNVNGLNLASNDGTFTKLLHIIEHEYTHILHQNKMYPAAYKQITTGYTSSWGSYTTQQANNMGFITPYAMAAPDEDFAEMVSTIITTSKTNYDAMINSIGSVNGRNYLRQKESIIASYFSDIYGIDIYSLQSRTVNAISNTLGR